MTQIAERAHIGAYIEAEQRQQLIELARPDDRSVSSVIRQALRAHVEREYRYVAALDSTRKDDQL